MQAKPFDTVELDDVAPRALRQAAQDTLDEAPTIQTPEVQVVVAPGTTREAANALREIGKAAFAKLVQAQIDAPPAGYADRAFTDAEWAMRYAEKCRERDDALAARDECAPFCEKHRADTAKEQLSAREQSATNLAAFAADPDNEDLHAAPMMTPDWTTRDLLRTYWREHVKDQKQLIYLARVATGADTHGVTELDRRGGEIRDALLRGYEQNEDLCFLDEVRRENERLKADIDAARADEREAIIDAIEKRKRGGLGGCTEGDLEFNSGRATAIAEINYRARSGARGV